MSVLTLLILQSMNWKKINKCCYLTFLKNVDIGKKKKKVVLQLVQLVFSLKILT